MKVIYCGSGHDPSGYGSANRADIVALFLNQVDVATQFVNQTLATSTYGWEGALCDHLEKENHDAKIKVIHLTPDLIPKYMEDGKYHISRLMWETDRLPKDWIEPLNNINEIWTATESQKEIIKASGVTTPIHCFPQPLDVSVLSKDIEPWIIPNFAGTIFYSQFQWIERKDPYSLLTTYWKTFEEMEDVVLILKTFRVAYSDTDFEKIKADIVKWKTQLKLKRYPRVLLVRDLWPTDKVWKLHKMKGIFISTSHGEGWGRPMVEASLMGNPVIAIDKTGFADIFPKDSFYPVSCTPAPVIPQSWISWYTKGQNWLNIDTQKLSEALLEVYNDQKAARERAVKAQSFVLDNLNYWKVGNLMKQRLEEINRFL